MYHKAKEAPGRLTQQQVKIIQAQMKQINGLAKSCCNFDSVCDVRFDVDQLATLVRGECSLLHQILEAMVLDDRTSGKVDRNADARLREATILLCLLGYVRSKFDNHVPTCITLALLSRGINSRQLDLLFGLHLGVSYKTIHTTLKEIAKNRTPHNDLRVDKYVGGSFDNLDRVPRTKFGRVTGKQTNYFTHGITRMAFEWHPPRSARSLSRTQGLHTREELARDIDLFIKPNKKAILQALTFTLHPTINRLYPSAKAIKSPFGACLNHVRKTVFVYLELLDELNTSNEGNQAAMDTFLRDFLILAPETADQETRNKLFLVADQLTWARCNTVKQQTPGYEDIILLPGDMHFHMQTIAGVFKMLGYLGLFKLAERIDRYDSSQLIHTLHANTNREQNADYNVCQGLRPVLCVSCGCL